MVVFEPCGSKTTRRTQSLSSYPARCVATVREPLSALRDDPPGPQGHRAPRRLPAPTPTPCQSRPAHPRVQDVRSPRPTRRYSCARPRTCRALAVVHPETRSLASGTHATPKERSSKPKSSARPSRCVKHGCEAADLGDTYSGFSRKRRCIRPQPARLLVPSEQGEVWPGQPRPSLTRSMLVSGDLTPDCGHGPHRMTSVRHSEDTVGCVC